MKVLELYNQFTTGWERVRAHFASHFIAFALLWLVGFALPLPAVEMPEVGLLSEHPLYQLLQNIGLVALVSFAAAAAVGIYTIVLTEIGNLLLRTVQILYPIFLREDETRRMAPRDTLFVIAATLDPGRHESDALGSRFRELLFNYSIKEPEEFRKATSENSTLQRDATTHLRNGLVFLLAWILLPWLLPGSGVAEAIDQVFWRGAAILLAYVLVARWRLQHALRMTSAWSYVALSGLILRDKDFSARLAAARSRPDPYWALVDEFRTQGVAERGPSPTQYLRHLLGLPARPAAEPAPSRLDLWEQFGWDQKLHGDYDDPRWFARYLKWLAARLIRRLRQIGQWLLIVLGLRSF